MAVGLTISKAELDAQAGNTALQVREAFRAVQLLQAWLVTQTNGDLLALGYAQADVDRIKSAFVDLDKLRTIYEGTATQATTYDFRQFAKLLVGVR